jgi:hypothetical protein
MSQPVRPPTCPSTRWRSRALGQFLAVLALMSFLVSPAKGDLSRNGGIIILPSATHACSWGKSVRASYGFRAGEDMAFQFDARLGPVVLVADTGAGTVPLGTVLGQVLIVRSADVRALSNAGAGGLRLRAMDAAAMGYELAFRVAPTGDITVEVL